ncbi:MAG: FAD/NAD(P)-binding oxidoreductase [Rhodocyclaceae bacterium]|nr:FAD/NAD(P)-binding oxidoreductase [Rhodocyclaceae bacterium]
MSPTRRKFLTATAAFAAALSVSAPLVVAAPSELLARTRKRRVVIVGGGWGGLAAARRLRDLAPDLEIVLIERNAEFWSCPLSNKWLAGFIDEALLVHDYKRAAAAYGYTFVQAAATEIDRDARRVLTDKGTLGYDWLILAVGIRNNYEAWYGDDYRAAAYTREHYPCAYVPGDEFRAIKHKLDSFAGGDLVMTLPPAPYRCPPSPYERACLIAWLLKSRGIKGKLTVIDPNPAALAFQRTFDAFPDQLGYLPQSAIKSVDPFNRKIVTEFDEVRFDDAILMPPQQAGDLVRQAGLLARAGHDQGWADLDPLHLHARADERIFLVGDLAGSVSPLFGSYPKSGHMAAALGRIAAAEIAARAHDQPPPQLLPESICHVFTSFDPPETTRFHTSYHLRGDGLVAQASDQKHDPNPRDEDVRWLKSQFADFLAD